MALTFSTAGEDLLKSIEAFRSQPYNDSAHNSTIGYGTLLHYGPVDFDNNEIDRMYISGITEDHGMSLLRTHMACEVEPVVNSLVKVVINQGQFDALCSFVYNVGGKAFRNSTLLFELNRGHYQNVPAQICRWVYADGKVSNGLVDRRKKESALWIRATNGGGAATSAAATAGGAA